MNPELRLMLRRLSHYKTFWRAFTSFWRGVGKFLRWYHRWISAQDKAHLIGEKAPPGAWRAHDNWCKFRRIVSFVVVGVTAALVIVLLQKAWPLLALLVLSAVAALVNWGRPEGKTVIVEKEVVPHKPVVSGDTIRQIVAAALPKFNDDNWERIRVLGQGVTWDKARIWWSVTLQMPGVVSGSSVLRAHENIRTGLGIGPSQLIIQVHPQNESIVRIMGTERDPWDRPAVQTPMMTIERTSVWDPIPIAMDKRGETVYVSLMMTAWLIGAIPRMGKTNLMALLALWVALDPDADMAIFNFKGGGDWASFEPLCMTYASGRSPDEFKRLVKHLNALQEEIERRGKVMSKIPHDRAPEGQLTRDLAADASLNMRPIFTFIDEVHWAFKHSAYGKQVMNLVEDIVKMGQYVGIYLILATQRPDSESIPTKIRDVIGTRAAGKCLTRQSSETILGTAAKAEGWDAARLPRKAGVFIIYGADDTAGLVEAQEVRIHRCDPPQRQMIAWHAAEVRDALGRMPNQIDSLVAEEPLVLRRAREVQGERPYVMSGELVDALNSMPEFKDEPWTFKSLGAALSNLDERFGSQPINRDGQRGRMGYNLRPVDED